jgi:hypothetical protein
MNDINGVLVLQLMGVIMAVIGCTIVVIFGTYQAIAAMWEERKRSRRKAARKLARVGEHRKFANDNDDVDAWLAEQGIDLDRTPRCLH